MAAEIHIIGQIESAYGFGDNRVACRWSLHCGGGWRVIEGEVEGQTHTDLPESERWPRILVEVWNYDKYGRHSISGYGNCFVPSSPGEHKVECHCWRPKGNFREELTRSFIGGGLQLRSANILLDPVQSAQLRTVAAGTVEMRLGIITRHLDKFGILC
uniref:B9 domain-containing protein 2 n=1 Tax=Meloidogyne incognita TaxID=6306 RepID=A0A914L4V8_MELIC